jgi:thioredoxin
MTNRNKALLSLPATGKRFLSVVLFVALGTFFSACNSQQDRLQTSLSPGEFATKLKQISSPIILDVRTPGEFRAGFIEGARNMDFQASNFMDQINSLDKSQPCFVYCLSGSRSKEAANEMRKRGFIEVYDMKGGLLEWVKMGQPLTVASAGKMKGEMSIEDYSRLIASHKTVLIDFYAPWCGPCKKMEPMLEAFGKENKGKIAVVRLNIDENRELAKKLGITEIPLLKIFQDSKEKWSRTGPVEKSTLTAVLLEL